MIHDKPLVHSDAIITNCLEPWKLFCCAGSSAKKMEEEKKARRRPHVTPLASAGTPPPRTVRGVTREENRPLIVDGTPEVV